MYPGEEAPRGGEGGRGVFLVKAEEKEIKALKKRARKKA